MSRIAACKDKLINIPISTADVVNTLERLPRTPAEAGLLEINLKRKLEYKNVHKKSFIDPHKIYEALKFMKELGNPNYQFYDDFNIYEDRCRNGESTENQLVSIDENLIDEIVNLDEYKIIEEGPNNKTNGIAIDGKNEDTDDNADGESYIDEETKDELEYQMKDPIRKYQFNYDKSVCLTKNYPEAAEIENCHTYSFAPGEGKIPENVLMTKDWDILTFPMKNPDGKNGLHQERTKRLSEQDYFIQRLRNMDTRYSEDPSYLFAAAAYLEKKQLQRHVNVSYLRGKESKSSDGISTYSLNDGFSVFDKISNTPKYWKTAKYEMLAKLDNLGPFHFFLHLKLCRQSLG